MTVNMNDVKKGAKMVLKNGWKATMADNMKGTVRMADVEGLFREIGSVYIWDIAVVLVDGVWEDVKLSPAHEKIRNRVQGMGF